MVSAVVRSHPLLGEQDEVVLRPELLGDGRELSVYALVDSTQAVAQRGRAVFVIDVTAVHVFPEPVRALVHLAEHDENVSQVGLLEQPASERAPRTHALLQQSRKLEMLGLGVS